MPASRSDFYAVEDLLSAEERAVRDTVRRFVDDEFLPLVRQHFADATFPPELTPRLAALGCFGPTEPDSGPNPGGMITRAMRVDGGFVLNGTKRWITNGSIADCAVV